MGRVDSILVRDQEEDLLFSSVPSIRSLGSVPVGIYRISGVGAVYTFLDQY